MSLQKIALLGTGLMGAPMARNLCQAGWDTTVWNRTAAKAEPLTVFGAKISLTAADAVAGVDIVISMLSDGPTGDLVQKNPELRAALSPGTVWVEMGSVKPEEARAAADDLVTTPTVKIFSSFAALAITCAAPVPVPPPIPAVIKTMLAP